MIDNILSDTKQLVSGNFCKNCVYSEEKGKKEYGEAFYALFCISTNVMTKEQNYAEGEEYTYAIRCCTVNTDGACAYYSAK